MPQHSFLTGSAHTDILPPPPYFGTEREQQQTGSDLAEETPRCLLMLFCGFLSHALHSVTVKALYSTSMPLQCM